MTSSSYQIQQLVAKLRDGDPDLRIMGLMDVGRKAQEASYAVDDATETQLVDQVLAMFSDSIAEVKSLAAKTISLLVAKVKEDRVGTIIEKLTTMTSAKDDALRDVASLGLKTVVKEISPDSKLASTACNKLAPKILAQFKNPQSSQDLLIQLIEVLADVYARFDDTIRTLPNAQAEGLAGLTPLLNDSRGAVRKRAIRALGSLVACSGESTFTQLIDKDVLPALNAASNAEQLKTAISLSGTLALAAPKRTGKRLTEIVGPVLKAAESPDEELKEVALQTLETFLLKCPSETSPFIASIVDIATKLIKYDPNYAADDDEMENGEDADANGANGDNEDDDDAQDQDEEDEEYEEEYDDDDDVSWKVRRGSVKILGMAVETRLELLSTFYKTIAPALVSRFGEREETVRIEVWNTYTALLKQTGISAGLATLSTTGPAAAAATATGPTVPSLAIPDNVSGEASGYSSRAQSPVNSLKRKRDEQLQSPDTPLGSLQRQTQQVAKIILKQLSSSKSVAVRLAGFNLLHQLIYVLQGGLENVAASLMSVIEGILKSADSVHPPSHAGGSSSTTSLKIQVYAFLALYFRTHPLRAVQPHLGKVLPLLTSSLADKSPKIGAAAFTAASELVRLIKPDSASPSSPSAASAGSASSAQAKTIYDATVAVLSRSDLDQELRERAIVCLGDLVIYAGADIGQDLQKALQILKDRLKNENTSLITLNTLARIADAPISRDARLFGSFNQDIVEQVVGFLRKSNKPVQAAAFVCLEALLRSSNATSGGQSFPTETCTAIVASLQPSIADPDIHLARSLASLASVLESQAQTQGKESEIVQKVDADVLPSVYALLGSSTSSPLSSAAATDAVLRFFAAYVSAGGEPLPVVAKLRELGTATSTSGSGVQTQVVASKSIGTIYRGVVDSDPKSAEKIIKETTSKLMTGKANAGVVCLGLLTVGEIGRRADMSQHQDIFDAALSNLSGASEDIRSASAFAIGNMAAGSPSVFLPAVLTEIQKAAKDDRKMHLLLGSVKEILSHSSPSALSDLSETLWEPLFQICEKASAAQQQQEQAPTGPSTAGASSSSAKAGDEARLDGTRNIAAECIGKITLANPSQYLGQLQSKSQSGSAGTRAAVVTAIRFTLSDDSSSYDESLAPYIVHFLSLMSDADLTVRRLAVSSLTSAAHNKPQLIRENMGALQPLIYAQTKIDPTLIREIVMGPFKVKVDNGLNIRKAAYQAMYTLLDTCLNKLDLSAFLDIVVGGLSDDDDIKLSCYLMLTKISNIAPTAVVQRLDAAATPFDALLKTKLKDGAVKQEVEKLAEMQRSALRTMATLLPLASQGSTPRFFQLAQETKAGALWGSDFKSMISNAAENKAASGANGADRMDID